MDIKKNSKFITAILLTFATVFATTLLLELPIFKHWLRQIIVVLFIAVQLYLGFLIVKYIKEK